MLKAFSKGSSCHSRSVQPISRLLSHSSHLIQPVQSLFSSNRFNGVSFEWALTHRSFSRILPDSSIFPELFPNLSKFDVRMIYHQSNAFLQDLKILSSFAHPFLFFIPEYLNNSWWCFSSSFSDFED